MTPVDQLHLHNSEDQNAEKGDCFRCCVATLLDMPASEVPHFCGLPAPSINWVPRLQGWLAPLGLLYIEVADIHPCWLVSSRRPLVIAGGKSPRGEFGHSVVGEVSRDGFRLIHDPHPSRAGIVGDPEDYGIFLRLSELPKVG
jgi:hypothetical protein